MVDITEIWLKAIYDIIDSDLNVSVDYSMLISHLSFYFCVISWKLSKFLQVPPYLTSGLGTDKQFWHPSLVFRRLNGKKKILT